MSLSFLIWMVHFSVWLDNPGMKESNQLKCIENRADACYKLLTLSDRQRIPTWAHYLFNATAYETKETIKIGEIEQLIHSLAYYIYPSYYCSLCSYISLLLVLLLYWNMVFFCVVIFKNILFSLVFYLFGDESMLRLQTTGVKN